MRMNDDDHRRHWAYEELELWRREHNSKSLESHGDDLIMFEKCPKCGSPEGRGLYWDSRTGQTHCRQCMEIIQ